MEKTLSMGAFTELDEREVMETEGGLLPSIIGAIIVIGGIIEGNKACSKARVEQREAENRAVQAVNQYLNTYGTLPSGMTQADLVPPTMVSK